MAILHHPEALYALTKRPGHLRFALRAVDGRTLSRRARVFVRDGGRCLRCGSTSETTLDHVLPVADGGKTKTRNLQVLCGPCNRAKGRLRIDYRPYRRASPFHVSNVGDFASPASTPPGA